MSVVQGPSWMSPPAEPQRQMSRHDRSASGPAASRPELRCRRARDGPRAAAPSGKAAAPGCWRTPDRKARCGARRGSRQPSASRTRTSRPSRFSRRVLRATRTDHGSMSVASTRPVQQPRRGHRQDARPGAEIENAPRPPPCDALQRAQTAARRAVLAGSEGQARIQGQRDPPGELLGSARCVPRTAKRRPMSCSGNEA